MKKDLRGREELRRCAEFAALAPTSAFDEVKVEDLRKTAELLRDYAGGSVAQVTIDTAAAFGGPSRHRLQCARRGLRALLGEDHEATRAVAAALTLLQKGRRRGTRQRDDRTRDAVLHAPHWSRFRDQPGAGTMTMQQLRAVDRFLIFCDKTGRAEGKLEDFLAFVEDQESSMLLRTLRDGLEALLTSAHPTILVAETARSQKEAERSRRRRPTSSAVRVSRPLVASVPREDLPKIWRDLFDTLLAGKRVRGRKLGLNSVQNMTNAARQLVWATRQAGLPDQISLDAIRAYDVALEIRGIRASSCQILFTSLYTLGGLLGVQKELLTDIMDLASYYGRRKKGEVKLKEGRLAGLPDLQAIFDQANALLDQAAITTDRRCRITLYVDAAALAFLSLIPLRNEDTVLIWGRHIVYVGEDDPADWGLQDHPEPVTYYLNLRTSKTGHGLFGPLAPILTPFFDALILRGRDERLLPQLRSQILKDRSPVFPTGQGQPRRVRSLSERWRVRVGTGAVISRTRIHTLLGALGEHGVRVALALCAQRSLRTAKWYQADALSRRRMLGSQEMIADLIETTEEDREILVIL